MRLNLQGIGSVSHVTVYDDALPKDYCETFIARFEKNEDDVQVQTDYLDIRHFVEVNVSQHWQDLHTLLVRMVTHAAKSYQAQNRIVTGVEWPQQYGYEQFRMKRYLPNGKDEFALHTDVGSYGSARRFLSFLWYLNTVVGGGETGFGKDVKSPDLIVPAVQGRLLIFPPLWTHPHWGAKVTQGPKYVISGYLHYI